MAYIGPSKTYELVKLQSNRWDWQIMTAIAGAESGWNSTAKSPTDDWGLFQINRYWHPQLFRQFNWADPYQNTIMAYVVWSSQHYAAWSTYTSGAYLKYMDEAGTGGGRASGLPNGEADFGAVGGTPSAAGVDYSNKVQHTGARGQEAFRTIHLYGQYLQRFR